MKKMKIESFIEGYPPQKIQKKAKNGPLQSINHKIVNFSFIKKQKKMSRIVTLMIIRAENQPPTIKTVAYRPRTDRHTDRQTDRESKH